jgi:hypothetical protein
VDLAFQGILAEILEFVMGTGLIPADGEVWRVRRRAIVPAVHRKVLNLSFLLSITTRTICYTVFGKWFFLVVFGFIALRVGKCDAIATMLLEKVAVNQVVSPSYDIYTNGNAVVCSMLLR